MQVDSIHVSEQWIHTNLKIEFRKQQSKDCVTATLLALLKKTGSPNGDKMKNMSKNLRYYWARFDQLLIEDGILGIKFSLRDGPTTQFRAIVPDASRQEILELAHNSAAGGDFGIQTTLDKLKQRFHWTQMSRDVQNWCEKCSTCNQHKTSKRNHGPLTPTYTGEPFERVAIDIIRPLPRTARDNRYILTVVDHLTKHAEAYALHDQEAATVARVFLH